MESADPKKEGRLRRKIGWIVLALVLVLLAGAGIYAADILSGLNHQELDPDDLGIASSSQTQQDPETETEDGVRDDGDTSITNIALFGIDEREGETQFRSDAIIIASVDKQHNKIKLSSLLRDTLVEIEGHGQNKLGHAYFYGGPQLAVKTLNQNFGLDIREYVTVNFAELASIIDAVGGIEIDVSEAEMLDANNSIWEQVQVAGLDPTPIEQPGLQILNGTQAVAYARIRHVGNADMERTDRQREVLSKLFDKARAMSPLEYPEFARKFLPTVQTSLDIGEILGLAGIMLRDVTLEDARFPTNADLIGTGEIVIDGVSYVNADIGSTAERLQAFIYDDINPDAVSSGSGE